MRKLGLLDAFAVARIIKAANLQKEMADFGMEVMRRKEEAKRRKAVRAAELKAEQDEAATEAEQDEAATEAEQDEAALSMEQIGVEAFITIISKCTNEEVERRIYDLYASIKGTEPDEVKYADLQTIRADIKELIELNDLKGFFALVSASMSKLRSF